MDPKEKAKELYIKIFNLQHVDDKAKMICLSTPQIAFLLCEEMVNSIDMVSCDRDAKRKFENYWTEVRKEVEKLWKDKK